MARSPTLTRTLHPTITPPPTPTLALTLTRTQPFEAYDFADVESLQPTRRHTLRFGVEHECDFDGVRVEGLELP